MLSNPGIDFLSENQIATFFSPASNSESVSFNRTKMDIREETQPTTKTFTIDMSAAGDHIDYSSTHKSIKSIESHIPLPNGSIYRKNTKESSLPEHEKSSFLRFFRRMSVMRSSKGLKSNSSSNQTINSENNANSSNSIFQRFSSFRKKGVYQSNLHTSSHPSLFLESGSNISTINCGHVNKPQTSISKYDPIVDVNIPITSQSMEFIEPDKLKGHISKSDVKSSSPNSVAFSDPFLYHNHNHTTANIMNSTATSMLNDYNNPHNSDLSDEFKKCVTPPPSYLQVSRATHGYSCLIRSSPLKNFNSTTNKNHSMGQGESIDAPVKRKVEFNPENVREKPRALEKASMSLDSSSLKPAKSIAARPSRGISCLSPCDKNMLGQRDNSDDNLRVQLRRQRTRSQNMTGESSQYDDSHFHRSSFIMMRVTQSTRQASNLNIDQANSPTATIKHHNLQENDLKTNDYQIDQGTVKSSTPMKYKSSTDKSSGICLPLDSVPELIQNGESSNPKRNGEYFLKIVEKTQMEILTKAADIENIIENAEETNNNSQISDEIFGEMRTTVGQAKLLIKEKFAQFRSLCRENLLSDSELVNGLRPLDGDLDGFWALVMIEVDNIRAKMNYLEDLRKNNWKPILVEEKPVKSLIPKKPTGKENKKQPINNQRNEDAQRVAARQRILAMKKQMKAKALELNNENKDDAIFVAF